MSQWESLIKSKVDASCDTVNPAPTTISRTTLRRRRVGGVGGGIEGIFGDGDREMVEKAFSLWMLAELGLVSVQGNWDGSVRWQAIILNVLVVKKGNGTK